jgi:hypothetical protein
MRTAEEWVNKKCGTTSYLDRDSVIIAIKEAQIEAIKECAEEIPICHVVEGQCGYNRQSILKLIDQVK